VLLPHLKGSNPSTPASIVEEWDASFEGAYNQDASHPLKDKVPLGKIGRRNINAPIVVNPDISFDHADSHDISIRSRRLLKYKMVTISALNPMQSPEKILVGVTKIARHPGVKIDHGFTFFSLTSIVYDNGRVEK